MPLCTPLSAHGSASAFQFLFTGSVSSAWPQAGLASVVSSVGRVPFRFAFSSTRTILEGGQVRFITRPKSRTMRAKRNKPDLTSKGLEPARDLWINWVDCRYGCSQSVNMLEIQKNVCSGRVLVQSNSQQVPQHWQPQWQWQSLCVLDYDVPFGRGAFRLDQGSTPRAFTGTGRLSSQAGILARTEGGTSHGSAELPPLPVKR